MSAASFEWLGRKAARIGNSAAEDYAKEVGNTLREKRGNRARALVLLDFAREKRDPFLERLFEHAIRERFPSSV